MTCGIRERVRRDCLVDVDWELVLIIWALGMRALGWDLTVLTSLQRDRSDEETKAKSSPYPFDLRAIADFAGP